MCGRIKRADPLTVQQSFSFNAAGFVRDSNIITKGVTQFGPGGSVRSLRNSTWTNEGVIELDESFAMQGVATILNAPSGTIDITISTISTTLISDETVLPGQEVYTIQNDGLLTKSVPGIGTLISASIENRGDIIADLGTITLSNYLRQTAGRTIVNGGAIVLSMPSRLFRLEGGLLGGTNTFAGRVENTGGSVQPAETQVGPLTIDNDYLQSGTGGLSIQIEGTTPGVTHDQLMVTGLADITGGTLTLNLINNYVPPVGTEFTILTAGSVQGVFTNVLGNGVFEVAFNPTTIVVTFLQLGNLSQLADFDNDNDVDLDDAQFIINCTGSPQQPVVPPCDKADLDGDGDVDLLDYQLFMQAFGP